MSLEIYWKKALAQTRLSIDDKSLYPLKTSIITRDLYQKNDFIIRKLNTSRFNKTRIYGPKQNPSLNHPVIGAQLQISIFSPRTFN